MGEYANIKTKKIINLLKWLESKNKSLTVVNGGKHQIVVKYSFWARPFPIPTKHKEVNRFIVKDLMEKLVNSNICAKDEFDCHL
ncbi:MAG: hypothetical protein V1667_03915 [bacterium]